MKKKIKHLKSQIAVLKKKKKKAFNAAVKKAANDINTEINSALKQANLPVTDFCQVSLANVMLKTNLSAKKAVVLFKKQLTSQIKYILSELSEKETKSRKKKK